MRFSSAVIAALPVLVTAQDYQAQFQNFLGRMGSYIPNPAIHDPIAAMEAKTGSMRMHTLTLDNFYDTLYEPVTPSATEPVEWWVLISGRNKTCPGNRCERLDQAYNETAAKFALLPSSPYMGYINCDDQPILCNSYSVGVDTLWAFDLLPRPAPVDIYWKRFNITTVSSEDFVALRKTDKSQSMYLVDSWFQPFNGKATELGLSVPFGWFTWAWGLVPNWLFMLAMSFGSRQFMSSRMRNLPGGPGAPPPARAGAPAAAQ